MDAQDNPGQPSAAEVLAETEGWGADARRPTGTGRRRVVVLADRFVFWLSKRWLAIVNTLSLLYVGIPILAPVLMQLGAKGPATVIYAIYDRLCNQLPQRSWFLFGRQFAYTPLELAEQVGIDVVHDLLASTFIGNEALGYKMALCERCLAIHGAILLFGLLYGLLRRRWKVPPLPWWAYIGFGIVPMLLDGAYQFLSYAVYLFWPDGPIVPHETTPLVRTVTGGLFGLATVWLAYPLVQEAMEEFQETSQQRFEGE